MRNPGRRPNAWPRVSAAPSAWCWWTNFRIPILFSTRSSDASFCVSANRTRVVRGDPKQAIYRFRGADLETYLRARRDVEALYQTAGSGRFRGVYALTTNYRSSPDLVRAFNAFWRTAPNPSCAKISLILKWSRRRKICRSCKNALTGPSWMRCRLNG